MNQEALRTCTDPKKITTGEGGGGQGIFNFSTSMQMYLLCKFMKFEFSRESSTSRSAHGEKNISFFNSTVLAYNLDNSASFNLIATST